MRYEYKTMVGNIEIEVDGQYYEILMEMDREEERSNSKHERPRHDRARTVSLDDMDYQGEWFDAGVDILGGLVRSDMSGRLRAALAGLTAEQQGLVVRVYVNNEKIVDIARENRVTEGAIRDRLRKIYAKIKKYLE